MEVCFCAQYHAARVTFDYGTFLRLLYSSHSPLPAFNDDLSAFGSSMAVGHPVTVPVAGSGSRR